MQNRRERRLFYLFLSCSYKVFMPFLRASERVMLSSFMQNSTFAKVSLSTRTFKSCSKGFSGCGPGFLRSFNEAPPPMQANDIFCIPSLKEPHFRNVHCFFYFLAFLCTRAIPSRTTSDFVIFSNSAASVNFCTLSSSSRTRNIVVLGLSVGRPIFLFSLICSPPSCYDFLKTRIVSPVSVAATDTAAFLSSPEFFKYLINSFTDNIRSCGI